jgi:2-polyprenyl-3-methyl-5-hydroxy-6-metoxy-1,4-benzoquinol methylase
MLTSGSNRQPHDEALKVQSDYFDARTPVRMRAADTPYIRRHLEQVIAAGSLRSGEAVCEWGAGMGRFSRLLAAHGLDLTAIELSPSRAHDCRAALVGAARARVEVGDVLEVLGRTDTRFDAMVGFFVLHHLPELGAYFRTARRALRPGGRIVFTEPNPFNPLYPLQVCLTPGMRWRAERGIYRLWPRAMERAALEAGFSRVSVSRYGILPRVLYNAAAVLGVERWPEKAMPDLAKAFQTIVADA